MSETAEQYSARLRALIGDNDPLQMLADAPGRLAAILENADPTLFFTPPAPGKWSVAQIAAHLADDELVFAYRFRRVLAKDGETIEGFDQNRWAEVMRYETVDPWASQRRFAAVRQWNVEELRRLSAAERQLAGVHSERGRETVDDMIAMYAGHDLNHFGQIERIVGAATPA
jgi:uncharacterized damage-inducible protein DinB